MKSPEYTRGPCELTNERPNECTQKYFVERYREKKQQNLKTAQIWDLFLND